MTAQAIWRPAAEVPGFADLQRLRPDLDPTWELTSLLLLDVIDAAAAIEYTVAKCLDAVAEAQTLVRDTLRMFEDLKPETRVGLSHPSIAEAYFEFGNLLVWIRALEDRIKRKEPGGEWFGVLPALDPGYPLAARVETLLDEYRSRLADDARNLANYTVHASRIPHPLASNARIVNDQLVLRIPDRTQGRRNLSAVELTYRDGRSVQSFATDALDKMIVFTDGLLDAFEEEALRLKKALAPTP